MSRENLEVIQAAYDAMNRGDMEALRKAHDPYVIARYPEGWPEPGPFVGVDEVMGQIGRLLAAFDTSSAEAVTDFVDLGDRVLARFVLHGQGRGPAFAMQGTALYTLRGGRITTIEYFTRYSDAVALLGLSRPQADAVSISDDDKARLVERMVDAINSREVPEGVVTEDFELVNASTAVTDRTYFGPDGARQWMEDFFDVLEEGSRFEVTEFIEFGTDYVVVRNRFLGRGSMSGAPFDMDWISVFWFRDGRIARAAGFNRRREAQAAVRGEPKTPPES
jgi:ketosteroid isomerase-like protein